MAIWLLVLGFMALIMTAMAVGVLMGRKPIAGSCGGLNQIGMKEGCDICGGKDKVCEEENRKRGGARRVSDESRGADLGYNATRR
ncbi:(Na+)-NQR maturation NqrM [Vreelandella sp. EE27]